MLLIVLFFDIDKVFISLIILFKSEFFIAFNTPAMPS